MYLFFNNVKNRREFRKKKKIFLIDNWTERRRLARGGDTHHLVVDFMEVNLTDFVDHVLVLVGDEAEASVSVCLLVEHQHRILDLKKQVPTHYWKTEWKHKRSLGI